MAYEYLKPYIFKKSAEIKPYDNAFYPVSAQEIIKAEKLMGYGFPSALKQFYQEIGYGFLTKGITSPELNYDFFGVNRINDPLTNAEIFLKGAESGLISQDTYEDLAPDDLPFFEISDSSSFMTMKLDSMNPNAVWFMGAEKIEDSFATFIYKLYHEGPDYYSADW